MRGEGDAEAAFRLADDVGVAQITEVKFVDDAGGEGFCVAKTDELSLAIGESIEARDGGSALLGGIGIVDAVVVEEIVGGELAPAAVGVDAAGGFVVADGFRKRRSGELVGAPVGGRNVFEQVESRSGPGSWSRRGRR